MTDHPMPGSFAKLVESSRALPPEIRDLLVQSQRATAVEESCVPGRGHQLAAMWWADLAAVCADAVHAAGVLDAEDRDRERAIGRAADEAMLEGLGITTRPMTEVEVAEAWPDDPDEDMTPLRWPDDFPSDDVVPPGV